MTYDNGKTFYKEVAQRSKGDRHSEDYDALDQGPVGTGLRHKAVTDRICDHVRGGVIVDLGCGTGLLLDHLARENCMPRTYIGVDLLPEREERVVDRLDQYDLQGVYVAKDLDGEWGAPPTHVNACIAAGLMGPAPFHTLTSLVSLIRRMQSWATHGIVTVPMQRPGFLGCEYQAHFDLEDVKVFLSNQHIYEEVEAHTEKEMVIWW